MPTPNLPRCFHIVGVTVAVFALTVAFVGTGFAFPTTVGLLINPHSAIGAIGMTIAYGICLILLVVLIVAIPMCVAALIRNPAMRVAGSLGIVGIGLVAVALLGILAIPAVSAAFHLMV